jgi:hypothetical protein
MLAVRAFTAVVWNVITVSFRQSIIPDELLGRVNSVYRFFAWGMMPIGSIIGVVVASSPWWDGRCPALAFCLAAIICGAAGVCDPRLSRLEAASGTIAAPATGGHGEKGLGGG